MTVFGNPVAKWLGACVVSGLLGFAAGNGHTTQNAIASTSDRLGQVQKLAACEDHRADKATAVAKQAIRVALVDAAPVPSAREIPPDCRHPKFMAKH